MNILIRTAEFDTWLRQLKNSGDNSTQSRDIKHAKQLLATLENKK